MHMKKAVMLMGALCLQSAAWSQGALRDPTMPPPGAVVAAPGSDASAPGATPAEALVQPTVQLVLVGPSRKYAVIDGHIVKPGGQMDQWRLTQISATGVVLRSDTGLQTVSAYPAVKKSVRAEPLPSSLPKNRTP
jgi:hypothetical protein